MGGFYKCQHPGPMPVSAGESCWGVRSITYFAELAYAGEDLAELVADYRESWSRMTAVCGLTATPAADVGHANVHAHMGPIDGPWNTLALTQLPSPRAPATVQLDQTFDPAETGLTRAQRMTMFMHEIGHALGLGHTPQGSGNLMDPVLANVSGPQGADVAALVERYGPPSTSQIAKPPTSSDLAFEPVEIPLPGGGTMTVTFTIHQST